MCLVQLMKGDDTLRVASYACGLEASRNGLEASRNGLAPSRNDLEPSHGLVEASGGVARPFHKVAEAA